MKICRLGVCLKCRGDLAFDQGDWICLQCGVYYYTGLYTATGPADPARGDGLLQIAAVSPGASVSNHAAPAPASG